MLFPHFKSAALLCCLVCCFFSPKILLAQDLAGQTIKGVVVDRESLQPIVSASILVVGTEPPLGAITDIDGRFRITGVPLGRRSLLISSLGYEDGAVQELVVGSGKEVELTIQLTESLVELSEIQVVGKRLNGTPNDEMATVSAQSFSVEQTKRYAAAVNDPARMALSFAGVAGGDDESNEIIIRGNSPRGLLWRMEGIQIPNPNHFSEQGSSSGGISALSVNVLANSDFFTGAFPAQYGNATSGVFDLRLRKGNNEKREYAFQAGVLGLDLAAEGPIGEKGGASYLANYRYSTLGVLSALGVNISGEGDKTTFQDATFKVHIPTKKQGYVSLWGMGGLSKNSYQFEGDPEISTFTANLGVVGLNYFHRLSKSAYLEGIVSYSQTINDEDYEEGDFLFDDLYDNRAARASLRYNRKVNARQTLQAGVIAHHLSYNLLEAIESEGERTVNLDEDGSTYMLQAYAQYKYRILPNLTATGGFHSTYFGLEGQRTLEPRLGMRWNYTQGKSLSFGLGLHSQVEALPVYLAEVPQPSGPALRLNRGLPLQTSAQAVIAHDWRFHPQWRWRLEAYYQSLGNVAVVVDPVNAAQASAAAINVRNGFVNLSLNGSGTGENYGIESTLELFFTGGWYALSATSLFRSRYVAADGVERPTRFAADFVQTFLYGKEWTIGKAKVNTLGLNLRLNWSGNNREAPIDLEASREAGFTIRDWDRNFEFSLPNYFRLDTGIRFRKNHPKRSWVLSLNIQNITNRTNTFTMVYRSRVDAVVPLGQIGLIPILNYRLEF
ncbi:MAG: TonB-dependent receptor [Bacteroidota bacterium]